MAKRQPGLRRQLVTSAAHHAADRLGLLALRKGDLPQASPYRHAHAQCRAVDIPLLVPAITAKLSLAYGRSGQVTEARRLLDQVEVQHTTGGEGNRVMLPWAGCSTWARRTS